MTEYRCPHCGAVVTSLVTVVPVSAILPNHDHMRRRIAVTDENIAEAAAAYAAGGRPAVKAWGNFTERSATRWIKRIRETCPPT